MIGRSRVFCLLVIGLFVAPVFARDPNVYPKLSVQIPRMSAPRVDGDLTDIGWTEASRKGGSVVIDLIHSWQHAPIYRSDSPRIVHIGYDSEAIYIAMITHMPDAANTIDAPDNGWLGDALAVDICVDPTVVEGTKGYIGLVINAAGLYGANSFDGKSREGPIKIASNISDIRWQLEVAIPFKWLKMDPPSPGDRIRISFTAREPAKELNNKKAKGLLWNAQRGVPKIERFGEGVFGR